MARYDVILRYDRLGVEIPAGDPDPAGAMAAQELMGGRFGVMSTLMNYTFLSFGVRGRKELRPFYDLIANIAAEEYGHIEAVGVTITQRVRKQAGLRDDVGKRAAESPHRRERVGRRRRLGHGGNDP
jgi:Mn-containing catalase